MMITSVKAFIAAALVFAAPFSVQAGDQGVVEEVLVILASESPQTQGMAMVLSNTMAEKGAKVNVLLCDHAGDLALKKYQASSLEPKDVTPGQMLRGLLKQGGVANVCALYLPNSAHTRDDLIDGVGVASPTDMAVQMLDPKIRTFSF